MGCFSICKYCICRKNTKMYDIFRKITFGYENNPQYFYTLGFINKENELVNGIYNPSNSDYLFDKANKICDTMISNNDPNGYFYKSDIYYFGYNNWYQYNKRQSYKLLETAIELEHKEAEEKLNYQINFKSDNLIENKYHCVNIFKDVLIECDDEKRCGHYLYNYDEFDNKFNMDEIMNYIDKH